MSGGWAGSDRRDRLPPDWSAIRAAVLRRDGYRCTRQTVLGRCLGTATQVDHMVRGDDHRMENLTSLCGPHHAEKSSREGNEAKAAAAAARRRPYPREPWRLR